MADGQCAAHSGLNVTLNGIKEDVGLILKRTESWNADMATAKAESGAVKDSIRRIEGDLKDVWTVINSLRRHVYIGVGVCLVLSALLPYLLKLAGN
jgi:hypothetical protein